MNRREALRLFGAAALGTLGAGCFRGRPRPISLWHMWRGFGETAFQGAISRFRVANPGVEIATVAVGGNELLEQLLAAGRSGAAPEVFMIRNTWHQTLDRAGIIRPLDSFLANDLTDLAALLRPGDLRRSFWQGRIFSVPASSSGGSAILFLNSEALTSAGIHLRSVIPNWREFGEASREFVARRNRPGEPLQRIMLDPFTGPGMGTFLSLCYGSGATPLSADGTRSLLASDGCLQVAHAMDDYVTRAYGDFGGHRGLLVWRQRFGGLGAAASHLPFEKGWRASFVGGSWDLGFVSRSAPQLDFQVQPIPGLNGLHGGVDVLGWSYAIGRNARDPSTAWKLVRHLALADDGNGRICEECLRMSAVAAVNHRPAFRAMGDRWRALLDAAASDRQDVLPAHNDFIVSMLVDIPLRRATGESIEAIFGDLDRRYQAYLDSLRGDPA